MVNIETKKPDVQCEPVYITLETQEEVDFLRHLFYMSSERPKKESKGFTSRLDWAFVNAFDGIKITDY